MTWDVVLVTAFVLAALFCLIIGGLLLSAVIDWWDFQVEVRKEARRIVKQRREQAERDKWERRY